MKKIPKRIHFATPMIDRSIPQDTLNNIKELFVCIWSQQVNIPQRSELMIAYNEQNDASGLQLTFLQPLFVTQTLLY